MNNRLKKSRLIRSTMVPAATVTTALLSPQAIGAAGELDPSFGNVGRLGPILDGPAWSVLPAPDGTILLGGSFPGFSYWGEWMGNTNFVASVSAAGTVEPGYNASRPQNTQVIGIARLPDGQVVAAGRRMNFSSTNTQLTVYRLLGNGLLDTAFGERGFFVLSDADYGSRTGATSVVLDPDNRIVVAGSRGDNLIVLRLLPDGTLDSSFGTAGVFEGPGNIDYTDGHSGAKTNILRTVNGLYRVTASGPAGCRVVGLTASGALDLSFGDAGIATVTTAAGPAAYCTSMDAQPDGRLLLAGNGSNRGFAARLLASGLPDPTFDAGSVANAMDNATAVAADGDTAVVVAGVRGEDVTLMRLDAGGAPDATFGTEGTTSFDLETDGIVYPVVNDLFVRPDRKIVAAGGVCPPSGCWWSDQAFVVQLLGSGGSSPGALGFRERVDVQTDEASGEAVLTVRRTGGRSGSVSLSWEAADVDFDSAVRGRDYGAASGVLTWAHGDVADQQIRIPILADSSVEEPEWFRVLLNSHQDGAGLGKHTATVVIAADGAPHGQFGLPMQIIGAVEGHTVAIPVFRDFYSSGAVSVTLTPSSGSAKAGEDFEVEPVTLTWADGETDWKDAYIRIIDDDRVEGIEEFRVDLSSPSGGALVGQLSTATVRIASSDRKIEKSNRVSGGGALSLASLLVLGLARLLRRWRSHPDMPDSVNLQAYTQRVLCDSRTSTLAAKR